MAIDDIAISAVTMAPAASPLTASSTSATSPPSVSPAPSTLPTTSRPSAPNRVEARNWDELNFAVQSDRAIVNVTRDIAFQGWITLDGGQDVTAFCKVTSGATSSGVNYCATFDGGGQTGFFEITDGSCLRLVRLRMINGYTGNKGGALMVGAYGDTSVSEAHLTACMLSDNEAFRGGGVFYLNAFSSVAAAVHLTGCTMNYNEAYNGVVFYMANGAVAHLAGCTMTNNKATVRQNLNGHKHHIIPPCCFTSTPSSYPVDLLLTLCACNS